MNNIEIDKKVQQNTDEKSTDLHSSSSKKDEGSQKREDLRQRFEKKFPDLPFNFINRDLRDIPGYESWDSIQSNDFLNLQEEERNLLTPEEKVVEELNKIHAIIHTDQYYILTEKKDPVFGGIDFSLESKQSFKNLYENKIVICSDGKSRTKAEIWLKSSSRREFKGINFSPKEDVSGFYNLWKGFSKNSRKGDCSKYWDHVKNNICSGDEAAYRFVRKWCAYIFQYPNEVHTALVLCGSQGVGKNSFVEPLGVLLGSHYVLLSNIHELVSNFNYHLKHAVLIHANEALWGGNRKEIGTLKAMITEKTCLIEGKGKDRFMVRNFKHIILSSNEDWPVHLDPDDRRFFVLRVSEAHKEDHAYFTVIQEQLENGGYEALLYDLVNEDLIGFNPRQFPSSEEAFWIKIQSSDSVQKYIYTALKEGCFDIGNTSPNTIWGDIATDSVFNDYNCWCNRNRESVVIKDLFSKKLIKIIPSITVPRSREAGKRVKKYALPDISIAKTEFQKFYKANSSIWND